MATNVIVSSAVNITPPFSVTVCDFFGNNCSIVGVGNTTPITFTLPPQFNTAPVVKITITDSQGCVLTQTLYCESNDPKQFQNSDYFYLMNGDLYYFQ